MDTLRLAWRNLWRNGRRTAVTVAATALALFTMVMYSGLVDGYLLAMERQVTDIDVGEVQVHHPEYRKRPSLYSRVEASPEALAGLEAKGFALSSRLLASGLAAAGDSSAGVRIVGVDPEADKSVSKVFEKIQDGAWLDPDRSHEVVIGSNLAKTLGIGVGGELIVLSQAADGSMANDLYTVRGVVAHVSAAIDRGGMYMLKSDYRELFVVEAGEHQLIVRTPPGTELVAATQAVRAAFPEQEVENWRGLMPTLAQMLDSSKAAITLMFVIIYLAIGIVVFNAMLMAVFERIKEFGVLKAIGYSPGQVMSLILAETTMQTIIATVAGILISLPMVYYLTTTGINLVGTANLDVAGVAFDPIWKASVSIQTFVTPVVVLFVIIFLASLYPALRAAFIKPIDAMRYQ